MRTFLVLACTFAVACGGSTLVTGTDSGTDAGSAADTSVDGGATSPCPAQPPTAGAKCAPPAFTCEYGTSANRACNTVATCGPSGTWTTQTPGLGCWVKNPPKCPSTYASVPQGTSCSDSYPLDCNYPEGICSCTPFGGGPMPMDASAAARWYCDVPADPQCPTPRAKLGTTCTTPDLLCDYGACTFPDGTAMMCNGGYWQPTDVPCPL
ncbi:MAG TPA: hypothetical protein VF316_21275 [Polyangiaceae bacterium]